MITKREHYLLENYLREEQQMIGDMEKELRKTGNGRLYMRKKGKRSYYMECKDGKQKGITGDVPRIYQLARKEYLTEVLPDKIKNYDLIKSSLDNMYSCEMHCSRKITRKYDELDPCRICWDENKYRWSVENYRTNPMNPESLKYITTNGVKMRSKSERTIGNKLEEHGVLYRYEAAFEAGGITYYPDFTIRRRRGDILLWEHFGLMHNRDYYFNAVKKIDRYRSAGFVQHSNLICTWEEDIMDMESIDDIIYRFILS